MSAVYFSAFHIPDLNLCGILTFISGKSELSHIWIRMTLKSFNSTIGGLNSTQVLVSMHPFLLISAL
jgi:hypothetical protein